MLTARSGPHAHLREAAIILGLCLMYAAVSSIPRNGVEHVAVRNAEMLIAFEGVLGIGWESEWNRWLAGTGDWLVVTFNWLYILTFMAVVPMAALAYYLADRDGYFRYRNVVAISLLLAVAAHALFPVAPPRMMPEHGFVDTMGTFGPGWYDIRDAVGYFNAYAALPSLHFAWALFFGVIFIRRRKALLKLAGFVYPVITLAAIVVTANHYLLDAAAGALLMAVACGIHRAFRKAGPFAGWRPAHLRQRLRLPSPVGGRQSVGSRG